MVTLRELKTALRALIRAPAFAVTTIIILAIGIGASVSMLTVYHAVLVRRLPVSDQDRIAVLWPYHQQGVEFPFSASQLERFGALRTMASVAGFAHYGAYPSPITDGARPLRLARTSVTANFFDVLGTRPYLGRLLRPEDGVVGASPVLVLSYSGWRRVFNGDSAVVGRKLLNPIMRFSYTIIGVAQPGLDFPLGTEAWAAIASDPQQVDLIARLRTGVTPAIASEEVLRIAQRILPIAIAGAEGYSLARAVLGDVRPVLTILTLAVLLLLAIVCVNAGNLLLLRGATRAREFAVRRAIGASPWDIVRQVLTESAILGAIGGSLGLVVAGALRRALVAFAPAGLPRLDVVVLSDAPLLLALAITFVAVLACGLVPGIIAVRGDVESQLRADSRSGTASRSRRELRRVLVMSQVALATLMIAFAGLLARSLDRLQRAPLGYSPDHLSVYMVTFPYPRLNTPQKYNALFEEIFTRVRALPGVTSLTPILVPAFIGDNVWSWKPVLEGQSQADVDATPTVAIEAGNSEYFRTFGIRIARGRGFTEADRVGAPDVVVVSDAVAKRLWPGQDPIGKRLRFLVVDTVGHWRTVVGVADDIRFRALRSATPMIYLPWKQSVTQGLFAVRSELSTTELMPAIRATLKDIDPETMLVRGESMQQLLAEPLSTPRLSAFVLSALGVLALLVCAVGLYGVLASVVRERTREIGIRMALGATPSRVQNSVLADALIVIAIGSAVGVLGAVLSSRLLTRLLYEVSPTDPVALAGACVVLATVGVLAAWLPARRATRIDPAISLRAD